jgi:hypothetical protein
VAFIRGLPTSAGGGGGADSGNTQALRATIVQPGDGSDFMVTFPVARLNDTYAVEATVASASVNAAINCPDTAAGDRTTTEFRVVTSAALPDGTTIDFIVRNR